MGLIEKVGDVLEEGPAIVINTTGKVIEKGIELADPVEVVEELVELPFRAASGVGKAAEALGDLLFG